MIQMKRLRVRGVSELPTAIPSVRRVRALKLRSTVATGSGPKHYMTAILLWAAPWSHGKSHGTAQTPHGNPRSASRQLLTQPLSSVPPGTTPTGSLRRPCQRQAVTAVRSQTEGDPQLPQCCSTPRQAAGSRATPEINPASQADAQARACQRKGPSHIHAKAFSLVLFHKEPGKHFAWYPLSLPFYSINLLRRVQLHLDLEN